IVSALNWLGLRRYTRRLRSILKDPPGLGFIVFDLRDQCFHLLKVALWSQETEKFDTYRFVVNSIVKIQNECFHVRRRGCFESRSDTDIRYSHQNPVLQKDACRVDPKTWE